MFEEIYLFKKKYIDFNILQFTKKNKQKSSLI